MNSIEGKPKIEINPLTAAIIKATNRTFDAQKTGGTHHIDRLKELTDILANEKGAVEIFTAIQKL